MTKTPFSQTYIKMAAILRLMNLDYRQILSESGEQNILRINRLLYLKKIYILIMDLRISNASLLNFIYNCKILD